jgi:hypothetical protein
MCTNSFRIFHEYALQKSSKWFTSFCVFSESSPIHSTHSVKAHRIILHIPQNTSMYLQI